MSLPMKSGPGAIGDQLAKRPGRVNHHHAGAATGTPIATISGAIDRLWQLAYAVAYRLLLLWWIVRRPAHHGALVALWQDGEILVLRSSYRPGWSLPGGGIARGESAREAASRELREEVGLDVVAASLHEAQALELTWEHRRDHTTIFELTLAQRPTLRLDNREIVAAAFRPPDAIAPDEVVPHVARYLARFRSA
jgi:8-oxo-dGTP pyrophosphatase MutT (NUDIX family)